MTAGCILVLCRKDWIRERQGGQGTTAMWCLPGARRKILMTSFSHDKYVFHEASFINSSSLHTGVNVFGYPRYIHYEDDAVPLPINTHIEG